MSRKVIVQGLARATALVIPFIIILYLRDFQDSLNSDRFFETLTDVVMLTVFLKFGVDTYIPGCKKIDNKIILSKLYLITFASIVVISLFVSLAFDSTQPYFLALTLTSAVLCFLLLAEILRIKGNYLAFYLLQSPALYILVVLYTFLFVDSITSIILLIAILLLFIYRILNSNFFEIKGNGTVLNTTFLPSIVSILVVLSSWKEVFFIRWLGDVETISTILLYTRFKILSTFFFTLRNARIPNIIRNNDNGRKNLIKLADRKNKKKLFIPALGMFCALLYGYLNKNDNDILPVIFLIMSTPFILIYFGNLTPILVFHKKYKQLIICYLLSLFCFLAMGLFLSLFFSTLFSIAISGIFYQLTLGLFLFRQVSKLK